ADQYARISRGVILANRNDRLRVRVRSAAATVSPRLLRLSLCTPLLRPSARRCVRERLLTHSDTMLSMLVLLASASAWSVDSCSGVSLIMFFIFKLSSQ